MRKSSQPADPRTLVLFGIPFHDVTMAETLGLIDALIAARRPAYLVTANLDFAAQASGDVELQRILVEAELVLCDGTPLVWASRLAGKPLRERVAGSDLVPALAAHAERRGYKIFLLGGEPHILEEAAKNLATKHPLLPPVRSYSPPFASLQDMDHEAILQRLQEAQPDILLVAFGCPKQEKWISMHYRTLGIPCSIGVGATVDFLAGKVSRAPAWISKLGLEWVYRLSQEPKRLFGRYWKDICFLISQSWQEIHVTRATRSLPPPAPKESVGLAGVEVISWNGAVSSNGMDEIPMPSMKAPFMVDLSGVTRLDSRGLGMMLRLIRESWTARVTGCFLAPSPAVKMVVEVTRLERILPMAATKEEAITLLAREGATPRLQAHVEDEGARLGFQLPERLTAENVEAVGQVIKQSWEEHPGARRIFMDFSDTTFVDSSGLGLLLRIHRMAASRASGRMEVLHLHTNIQNVIRVARLENLLLPPMP